MKTKKSKPRKIPKKYVKTKIIETTNTTTKMKKTKMKVKMKMKIKETKGDPTEGWSKTEKKKRTERGEIGRMKRG